MQTERRRTWNYRVVRFGYVISVGVSRSPLFTGTGRSLVACRRHSVAVVLLDESKSGTPIYDTTFFAQSTKINIKSVMQ